MELKKTFEKITNVLLKYKYVILILVIGILLMSIPKVEKDVGKEVSDNPAVSTANITAEEELSKILSFIEGAGEVRVFLTESKGVETIYQTNEDYSSGNDSRSTNSDTVTVTDSQRNQNGLVKQVNPPEYLGAVIVCGGGGDPNVRLAIVDAVSKVTGLKANQISVLKMK